MVRIKEKESKKVSKNTIEIDRPTHLKFNLSFITRNNEFCYENHEFDDTHKLALLSRMYQLSRVNMIEVMGYNKHLGFEWLEKDRIRDIEYDRKYDDSESRRSASKFAVMRLYPNNNPIPARIVGKIVKNVFYILYIDLHHSIYR